MTRPACLLRPLIVGQPHAFICTPERVVGRRLSNAWQTFDCQSSDRLFAWLGGPVQQLNWGRYAQGLLSHQQTWLHASSMPLRNRIADADLEDHKGRSTQDNSSTVTQTILDVETCMMSSKIAHQSKCGPTKSVFYTQWTQFLELIGISLANHSILSAQIDGKIPEQAQEKALGNLFNNPECEVLIASISTAGTGLNITCANIVYLMVRGPPKSYSDFGTLKFTSPGAQFEPSN
ncbi:hypothetical protein O181_048182 [Austropuccinia psidii MF-1]|uniref:Helicase C-terminal domain-containing protein n=1 Tax=Austropuccinia psidii MF-1 TaxID=1389203 RepID=A0A9Q3HLD5_9BASI|nr:hypothetical protein [Austropuccinia psidii MF-1]